MSNPKTPARPGSLAACCLAGGLALGLGACGGTAPTAEPLPAIPPTQPPAPARVLLVAKDLLVDAGGCTTLEWETENVRRAYLDGRGVDLTGSQEVCPGETTTYRLSGVDDSGAEKSSDVTIEVAAAPTATAAPTQPAAPTRRPATAAPTVMPTAAVSVNFYGAHGNKLEEDQKCTRLHWETTGVTDVRFQAGDDDKNPDPVDAVGSREVCFEGDVVFRLYVRLPSGEEQRREFKIEHKN